MVSIAEQAGLSPTFLDTPEDTFSHNVAQMSHLMRLWHFSSSVNSFFKQACAAIQWG